MGKVLPFVTFTVGAAIGSVAAWYFAKKKYEQIAQEEIDSVKAVYRNKVVEDISEVPVEEYVKAKAAKKTEEPSIMDYASKISEEGYTNYSNMEMSLPEAESKAVEIEEEDVDHERPYVISPDEYGELDDYENISLTYYSDGVLADDMDELVDDVDGIVGRESLEHFGEYEEDSVFVRNDVLKADYEILLDNRKYSDVIKAMPYRGSIL